MSVVRESRTVVRTDRGARYGKQLAAHLGRRLTTSWDGDAGTGLITFDQGRCDVTATTSELVLDVTVDDTTDPGQVGEVLARMEDVVGRHLVRFGARDELVAAWVRSDGTAGPTQENHDDGPAGLHRAPERPAG